MAYGSGWAIEESGQFIRNIGQFFADDAEFYELLEGLSWILLNNPFAGRHVSGTLWYAVLDGDRWLVFYEVDEAEMTVTYCILATTA